MTARATLLLISSLLVTAPVYPVDPPDGSESIETVAATTETAASDPTASDTTDDASDTTADASDTTASSNGNLLELTPPESRYENWLEEVVPLITGPETELYLSLEHDYQRDAFVEKFWRVRDPYPRTTRNELKERWPIRVAEARAKFERLDDDRSRALLVHDRPDVVVRVRCTTTQIPAEVWGYRGSDHVDFPFVLVFLQYSSQDRHRLWIPGRSPVSADQLASRLRRCENGSQLNQVMSTMRGRGDDYLLQLQAVMAKPKPSSTEWVDSFVTLSTDLPADAEPLSTELVLDFPGRYQNRTVVQGLLAVPTGEAVVSDLAGYRSYDFLLVGEVVRPDDRFFESFRYTFSLPADRDQANGEIPIVFQRYLRPGDYRLVLRLEDLNGDGGLRIDREIAVPARAEPVPGTSDALAAELFAEAAAVLSDEAPRLEILEPPALLLTGPMRFDVRVLGKGVESVRFLLDEQPLLTKNRAPWEVEIDLGDQPALRTLRVEGLDAEGRRLASDEMTINGGRRFLVELVEPRRGETYGQAVQAQVAVTVPEGKLLDRVELFLDQRRVATLYQEPFVHPVVLTDSGALSFVRAVAHLADGSQAEDLVFINAPDIDEVDVQLVELYTTVLDRAGRPVTGLTADEFTVEEDGRQQTIQRFERVEESPIQVGVMIDNSASMRGSLGAVRGAALGFFQTALRPEDRAAVIVFNRFPNLLVELTSDTRALGAGLAGLVPEGETALWDSVMYGLYYLAGIRGQRALLILSDGRDEASTFSFDDTLDYARRAGVTLYTIALGREAARGPLRTLAEETGGRFFRIGDASDLDDVYATVQRELRSQYVIAYQSDNSEDRDTFRRVQLEVSRPDVTVKTLAGYYPSRQR